MLRNLYRMGIFARVVEEGSFTSAAQSLSLGKSVVSQHVRTLEEELGIQLLNRNTRSLHLTDEGGRFYERCRTMLDAAEGALADVAASRVEPRGLLRVTAPINLGTSRVFVEALGEFRSTHPNVQVELDLEDAVVDLIGGGFDVAFRVGWLTDSGLFARRLAPFRIEVCASREYLQENKIPRRPQALLHHPILSLRGLDPNRLQLTHRSGRRMTIKYQPAILTNTGIAARQLVLAGLGVGLVPDYAVRDDIRDGRLQRLLPAWATREGTISAVFPHRERLAPRTRVFVDLFAARIQQELGKGR